MHIFLLTRSSFSHDLSNFLYLRHSLPGKNTFFIILSFSPFKLFNQKQYFLGKYKKLLPHGRLLDVECSSSFHRVLFLFSVIIPLSILHCLRILRVSIVQPSPAWMYHRFSFFSFLIPRLPSYLVGDGVGSESLSSAPFWLSHLYKSSRSALIQSSNYVFSLEDDDQCFDYPRFRYQPDQLVATFDDSLSGPIEAELKSLFSSLQGSFANRSIVILVTSTFYEYSRMPLDKEMQLYKIVLDKLCLEASPKSELCLILKLHPLTSSDKINCFKHLKTIASNSSSFIVDTSTHFLKSLMPIPLESLVAYVNSIENVTDITLVSASAASLPSVLAYPKIKHSQLFGSLLSRELFCDSSKYEARIRQEAKISNFLSSNI